jgi:hypothetical protein
MLRVAPVAFLLAALLADRASAAVPTLTPDQLKPGQKAVVRTVFAGDKIEEFDAEIVGVLKTGRVSGDLILAKATGDRMAHLGVAQGMSGSPVYVDGKLVGALSSGWSFNKDPLFGVTPIGEMLDVLTAPETPGEPGGTVGPTGIEPGTRATPEFRGLRWSDSPAPPISAATGNGATPGPLEPGPQPLPIPVACVGASPATLTIARQLLAPLGLSAVPGGRTSGTIPGDLVPGAAVGVELMGGDLQLAAIGTVTWRDADRVLIFGHPFFQSGPVKLPLTSVEIITVVASDAISFKVGSVGAPLGMATQDRRAAVAGRLGPVARLMPMSVKIGGSAAAARSFRFESIEDRNLVPQLAALATLNSLLESGGTGAGQTVRWTMTLFRKGVRPLRLEDQTTGAAATNDLIAGIAQPLSFLYNNPYATLALDSLAIDMQVAPGESLWTVRNVRLLDATVKPGATLHARCQIERWRGGTRNVNLDLRVPEEVPDGRYLLWVGGGQELTRYEAQRLPGRYRPASLEEAWKRIGELRNTTGLYATLLARAPELTREGRDYPELPTSALALLSGGAAAEDVSRRGSQAILDEVRLPANGHLHGELLLEVVVDRDGP